jgi:asparagine synthase (glutamine-hydrolysing)
MIFGILPSASGGHFPGGADVFHTTGQGLTLFTALSSLPNERLHKGDGVVLFTSEQIILRGDDSFHTGELKGPLMEGLGLIQNVVACMEMRCTAGGWEITASSGRIGRARIFYTAYAGGLLLSNDLRELLPYTQRRLNRTAVYSVLKFGDVPEHMTVVQGIHTIPVGQVLSFTAADWPIVNGTTVPRSKFKSYYRLTFPMDGGDIATTRRLLESEFALVARLNPLVPISGGVDSTLMNRLIDRAATERYPAYFVQFGPDDPEQHFARQAVAGTRADLTMAVFTPKDTLPAFEYQTRHLIQPIGESSTISTAHFFRTFGGAGHRVVDGTLADGCYGSADYGRDPLHGIAERPNWQLRLNEQISVFLRLNGLPGRDRFHPRDSMLHDPLFRFMSMYIGPYANVLFNGAEAMNTELEPDWLWYYDYLGPDRQSLDRWMMYSVFKMVNYASKNNTAKSFDMARPHSTGIYPFMWLAVLQDQGHYPWKKKVPDGIMKFTLKKILEDYMPKDFIYRKKVGLNSCFEDWIYSQPEVREHFSSLLGQKGGLTENLTGTGGMHRILKAYANGPSDIYMAHLVINLSILQAWADHHRLTLN